MFKQVSEISSGFTLKLYFYLSLRGKSLAGSKPPSSSSSVKDDRKPEKDKAKSGSGSRGSSGTSSSKHKPSPAKVIFSYWIINL